MRLSSPMRASGLCPCGAWASISSAWIRSPTGSPATSRPSMRKLLLVLGAMLILTAAAGAIYWQRINVAMGVAGPHQQPVQMSVKPGATVRAVLAELEKLGALSDRRAVELRLRVRGWPQIKTGRYEIPARATPQEIIDQLEA